MVRLPTPGGDAGDWGDILNDFLEVSHASDGKLTSNVVDTPQLKNGSVTNAKLDSTTQTQLAQGASAYQKPGAGIPKSDLTTDVQTSLDAAGSSVQTVNGQSGPTVTLTASDVGAASASDLTTETSRAEAAEALLAPLDSPDLTGTPTVNGVSLTSVPSGLAFYDIVGHSIPGGGGVTNGDWNDYVYKLAHMLGSPRRIRNFAIGGSVSCWQSKRNATGDGGFGHVLGYATTHPAVSTGAQGSGGTPGPYLPQADLVINHSAQNDLAALGVGNPTPMQEAQRTIIARMCAAAVAQITDTTLTFTGSGWGAAQSVGGGAFSSPAGYKVTTNVGDSVSWTVPQISADAGTRTIGLVILVNPAFSCSLGINIDGVAQADVVINGSTQCDTTASQVNAITRRYSVDETATHTVVVTLKTGSNPALAFDSAYIEADSADGPICVVPSNLHEPSYAIWNSWPHPVSGGDADVDAWNTALQTVCAEFPHCLYVDLNAAMQKDWALWYGDGAHPNNKGQAVMAQTIYDALLNSGKLTSRQTSRVSPTLGDYWIPVGAGINAAAYPAFQNSWVNFGSGWQTVGYRKDSSGVVHLRGFVKSGSSASATIFTLPTGYRPGSTHLFATTSGGALQGIQINSTGVVFAATNGSAAVTSLEGISFLAEG